MSKESHFLVSLLMVSIIIFSCNNKETYNCQDIGSLASEECKYNNPIDSIVQNTEVDVRFDEVYSYLVSHPDFITDSDNHAYRGDALLWKDCGNIRIYSIPWESIYSALGNNIVQIKGKACNNRLDTAFLRDNVGRMDNLFKVTNQVGKTYYILKTSTFTVHQGVIQWECICAFSIEKGKLVKEKLFHSKSGQHDVIEVECGGQRELPLYYDNVILICLDNIEEEDDGVPVVVIAEINKNDWPTGYGLKYQWNGNWFEYVGKCLYDVNDIIH